MVAYVSVDVNDVQNRKREKRSVELRIGFGFVLKE